MPEPPTLAFDRGTLTLSGLKQRPGAFFKWDGRTRQWRCSARHYAELQKLLQGRVHDTVPPPPVIRWPQHNLPQLREDQQEALAKWEQARCRGQIIMPTGTGKTVVALAAMARCAVATLVVAPIRDLMYQWHRAILQAFDMDAGIVGDGLHQVRPVTVTTYDSAYIYMEELGDRFGLVVFDEVHHLPATQLQQAAEFCAASRRLGLTATPERSDGRHALLDELVGPVAYRQEMTAARGQTLADYRTVRIPIALQHREQQRDDTFSRQIRSFMQQRREEQPGYRWEDVCKDTASDPQARSVLRAFHAKTAIETRAAEKLRVLEDLFRLHAAEPVLVFTGSNQMAIDVSRRFLFPMIIDKTGKSERQWILDRFKSGRMRALVANQVLDEGIDVPAVKVAVVLGGLSSSRQAKQRLGRILRKSGSVTAVLYEVVCDETREALRSRMRRRGDEYRGTRHMRL